MLVRQALGGRADLIVILLVGVLTVVTLGAGVRQFADGTPRESPAIRGGSISVLTDDPDAIVTLKHRVALHHGEFNAGAPEPLTIDIRIDRDRPDPLRWAVVLVGDAALPGDRDDPAGSALPNAQQQPGDVRVIGNDGPAWFVRDASASLPGVTPSRVAETGGSALVGTYRQGGAVELSVVAPTAGRLLVDTGPSIATNLPELGVPTRAGADPTRFLAEARERPVAILAGADTADQVGSGITTLAETTEWYHPVSYDLSTVMTGQQLQDRIAQAEPLATSPAGWSWAATDRLFVRAVLDQPQWTANAQRQQFIGGLLAGVGGGALVWFLELSVSAVLRRFGPRDSTPSGAAG